MDADRYVEVGKVAGVHGVRGLVLLRIFIETGGFSGKGEIILLNHAKTGISSYKLESAAPHKGKVLVRLFGVTDRDSAKKLVGRAVIVEKDNLPILDKGEYYEFELIGLEVFEKNGNCLGILESIIKTGANDVYEVKREKDETLVPALPWVVLSVDLAAKKMVVDLPEGL